MNSKIPTRLHLVYKLLIEKKKNNIVKLGFQIRVHLHLNVGFLRFICTHFSSLYIDVLEFWTLNIKLKLTDSYWLDNRYYSRQQINYTQYTFIHININTN